MHADLYLEIKQLSKVFVDDTFAFPIPSDYAMAENAMLIGATAAIAVAAENMRAETDATEAALVRA